MPSPHPGGPRRTLMTGLVVVLTATPGLVACTGEEPRSEGSGPAASSRPGTGGEPRPARRVRTHVAVGEVVGALGPVKRRRVATGVGRAVDRWWDAAFVDATYPRRRYRSVFPGFTPGAAQAARRDLDRMTSHRLGERIDALTPMIQSESNKTKRDAMIAEVYKRVHDNVYFIPLHQQALAWGKRDNVSLTQRGDNVFRFRYVNIN